MVRQKSRTLKMMAYSKLPGQMVSMVARSLAPALKYSTIAETMFLVHLMVAGMI